jgi:flagellar motor switch protein FliN/FliY
MPNARVERVRKVEVPIIVQLGQRQMKLADVLSIIPGSILELPKSADEDLDLLVANKSIGSGEAVKIGENFGLRIRHIGDLRERIEAMRPGKPKDQQQESTEDEAAALAEAMLAGQM